MSKPHFSFLEIVSSVRVARLYLLLRHLIERCSLPLLPTEFEQVIRIEGIPTLFVAKLRHFLFVYN